VADAGAARWPGGRRGDTAARREVRRQGSSVAAGVGRGLGKERKRKEREREAGRGRPHLLGFTLSRRRRLRVFNFFICFIIIIIIISLLFFTLLFPHMLTLFISFIFFISFGNNYV
jgi:hypothetical protein